MVTNGRLLWLHHWRMGRLCGHSPGLAKEVASVAHPQCHCGIVVLRIGGGIGTMDLSIDFKETAAVSKSRHGKGGQHHYWGQESVPSKAKRVSQKDSRCITKEGNSISLSQQKGSKVSRSNSKM